jgi:TPR repeat protein
MKFSSFQPVTFLLVLLLPIGVNAADSLLRIACEGENAGAEVMVNGKFRGECPLDVQVPAGILKLSFVKKGNSQTRQAYKQEFRIGEASVKKIELHFDFETAQQGARAGNTDAMYQMFGFYLAGSSGVTQDNTRAREWLFKAAEAGNVRAMSWLATNFTSNSPYAGLAQNYGEGLKWYRRAADKGDSFAAYWVGLYYERGLGVPKDNEEAAVWYRKVLEGTNADDKAEAAKRLKILGQ